jgi:hypothetical protein
MGVGDACLVHSFAPASHLFGSTGQRIQDDDGFVHHQVIFVQLVQVRPQQTLQEGPQGLLPRPQVPSPSRMLRPVERIPERCA